MKTNQLLPLVTLLALTCPNVPAATESAGNYRIPYASGSDVTVLADHLTHPIPTTVSLFSTNASGPVQIVAAADGIIRFIEDGNSAGCTLSGCTNFNNYVWIEHANGEWTGYGHMTRGSTTGAAGLSVGVFVTAGTYLGNQGRVGLAATTNLAFEVAVPDDPDDPIVLVGGAIKGTRRIPIICGITGNILVAGQTYVSRSCFAPEFSSGVYRIPLANGTQVKVTGDHMTHDPATRIDMVGTGGREPYHVVAAADGIIRAIVETNTLTCSSCSSSNNYVWISHPNGEWTKYTHMQTGTTTARPPNGAGLKVGDQVCAGTYLGDEDDVGAASGKHVHFEVGVPDDLTDPFNPAGGFIRGKNRIPVICGIPGNIFVDGQTYTAGPCSSAGCVADVLLPSLNVRNALVVMASDEIDSNNATFRVDTYGSVTLRAGSKITLRPGFRSVFNSFLHVVNRDCNEMPGLPGCTLILPAASTTAAAGEGVTR